MLGCIATDLHEVSISVSVCSCLNAGLTAARINLIFGMHTLIGFDCNIGYIILTFEIIKGHFRSNKLLCKVPSGVLCGTLGSKRLTARDPFLQGEGFCPG